MGAVVFSAPVERECNEDFCKDDTEYREEVPVGGGMDSDQKLPIDCTVECDHVLSHSPYHRLKKSDVVAAVERELDVFEKISLVFLLYDDVELALQTVQQSNKLAYQNPWPTADRQLVWARNAHNNEKQVLTDWVRSVHEDTWWEKMEEALSIIQNYHVLHLIFGKEKDEVEARYLPEQPLIVSRVDIIRKCLFLMSDKLSNVEWNMLLKEMNAELVMKDPKLSTFLEKLPNIPEVHMLSWMAHGLLKCRPNTPLDFSILATKLKKLSFLTWADKIEGLTKQKNELSCPMAKSPSRTTDFRDQTSYNWNPKKPGVILIFNQTEFEDPELEYREGTKTDFERLQDTFNLLNFIVKPVLDCKAKEIIQTIKLTIKEFPEDASCLAIAVLSHGKEGTVYASDEPLPIKKIRRLVETAKNLAGKPKLILIQACQGSSRLVKESGEVKVENCEETVSSAETDGRNMCVEIDGPKPTTADVCLFIACVPGFEAYRSTAIGSFFIQEFCNEILLHGHEKRFEILATDVIGKLSDTDLLLKDKTVRMVPEQRITLTKKLYLGVPEEHRAAAKLNVEKRKKMEEAYYYEVKRRAQQKELTNMPQRRRESFHENRNITSGTSLEENGSTDQGSNSTLSAIRSYLDEKSKKQVN